MGRPSSYKPEYAEQAAKLCKLGATDREIAEFFKVVESTLNLWKLDHPEFSESLKRSKHEADERVEQSLYRRALGYSHDAVKILMTKDGDVYREEYVEHYPPDTTACIFWLKNRKPDAWRDVKQLDVKKDLPEDQRQKLIESILERIGQKPTAAPAVAKSNGSTH